MQNVVCWKPNDALTIINPEAEAVPDYIFRAIHTEQKLQVAEPKGTTFQSLTDKSFVGREAVDFLEDFLRPERAHVQVAVYGRSGSGKSHLIHWMRLNIPASNGRLVLTVPKAGTSLRAIVEMIIRELPSDAQEPFWHSLRSAGDSTMTETSKKHELLNQIAQSIREMQPLQVAGIDKDLESELRRTLPNIFQDPYMREQHFLKEHGIIDRLANHVFSVKNDYDPLDDRYRFHVSDLPVAGNDWRFAALPARDAIDTLLTTQTESFPLAIEIINRSLDGAIARALSFSGDRITALLTELRKFLRRNNAELIFLIEDIARLQGIDRALLQALLTRGDEELCNIRWALAATTGFLETIVDTLYTRMTYLVDMDRTTRLSQSDRSVEKSLAEFSGRYLNAVRVGNDALRSASLNASEISNPCDSCVYRNTCHNVFGDDGIGHGLYPFTRQALRNMAIRSDEQFETSFNPRIFQRSVLVRVLDTYSRALAEGDFPPAQLLVDLGGVRNLTMVQQNSITTQMPAEAARVIAVLELWHGSLTSPKRNAEFATAFSIETIPYFGKLETDEFVSEAPQDDETKPVLVKKSKTVLQIDKWAAGGTLSQTLAQDLRVLVFAAIDSAIDWDSSHLDKAIFSGPSAESRPFKQRSINFQRQESALQSGQVKLLIPADGASEAEKLRTALAIQGLLISNESAKTDTTPDWEFEDGTLMLSYLQDCLEDWTTSVLEQLERLQGQTENWDAVVAATELLGIGGCLAGNIRPDGDLADLLTGSIKQSSKDYNFLSAELQGIAAAINDKRELLRTIIWQQASWTKGGRRSPFLDPRKILPTLQQLRIRGWTLSQDPPAGAILPDNATLVKLYASVKGSLPNAAASEKHLRIQWYSEIVTAFGEQPKKATIISTFTELCDVAVANAFGGASVPALRENLKVFSQIAFDDAIKSNSLFTAEDGSREILPSFAQVPISAFIATRELLKAGQSCLNQVETHLNHGKQMIGEGLAVAKDLDTIAVAFASLETTLK